MISADFAEMLGVLLGDGCICRYPSGGRERFVTAFTASSSEFWYCEGFVQPTFKRNFGVSGYLYKRKDNTTRYSVYREEVAIKLASKGVPIGRGHHAGIP